MSKNRIVIEVHGGLVEAVYKDTGIDPTNTEDVIILDYDMCPVEEFSDEEKEAIEDIKNAKLIKLL